jgi:hypothetical protein
MMSQVSEHVSLPVQSAVPIEFIRGDDELDTKLLCEMADEADRYIRSLPWCVEIHEKYFGDGVGGIVALFLFRITIRKVEAPEWVWVIVGDLPSCYLEFEGFPTPHSALLRYIEGIEEWLEASQEERNSGDLIPIEVPPDPELIGMLKDRAEMLRASILPHIRNYS